MKECKNCKGYGVVDCYECSDVERVHGGDYECPYCDENGQDVCADCEGEGEIDTSCGTCGGSGGGPDPALYCPSCHGSGEGRDYDGN